MIDGVVVCRSSEKVQEVQKQRRQMAAAGRGGCRFAAAGWWVQCAGKASATTAKFAVVRNSVGFGFGRHSNYPGL